MVTVSQQKYDGILAALGIVIVLALAGTVISPTLVFASGLIGFILMGVGMFSFAPTDAPIPEVDRKI